MYDLAIIGAGPAGLSASVYASRYGIKNLVIGEPGGLAAKTHEIGNWLGTEKISGWEFAQKSVEHAKSFGAEIISALVDQIEKSDDKFFLYLNNGKKIQARIILLATGTKQRKLGIPGEQEFFGKGVSYCATCDGFFYKNKIVAVVGGNDSAAGAAAFLSDIAKKVYIIYRGEKIRAEEFWFDLLEKNPKIEVIVGTNVKEIKGGKKVEKVILDNPYYGAEELALHGVFVEIGFDPRLKLVEDLGVETDEEGYIRIEADGRTSIRGIWAAGDVTTGSNKFKQIVTAVSEGAIAAGSIQKYLKNNPHS